MSLPDQQSASQRPFKVIDGMPSKNDLNQILKYLVKDEIVSKKQIEYAFRIKSKIESEKPLIEVLKDLEYITDDQVKAVIRKYSVSMKLGTLLLELGYISIENLEIALKIQREENSNRKLGEILIEKHFTDERTLSEILALQLGIPFLEPSPAVIDQTLLSKASKSWYESHSLIPIRNESNGVLIAFADPQDKKELEAAQLVFGKAIIKAVTTRSVIKKAIKSLILQENDIRVDTKDESAVVKLVNSIIAAAHERNASDIHIEPMKDRIQIRFRQDGVLIQYDELPIDTLPALTNRIKVLCDLDITERRRHQGGRFLFRAPSGELDLRTSFYVTVHGQKVVLRLLNRQGQFLSIEQTGLLPKMLERFKEDALLLPSGVILITGPTGSGKTTTVYSCINEINQPDISIITAEDPVEYVVEGISQCSLNPKINLTFEETLRHIVRQDPDVIVIGEIRDDFSAQVAVQAALTGHKVLTTFHTEDSIGGLVRLLNMNVEAFLISSTVVSVMAQRLLRKVCTHCAAAHTPGLVEIRRLGYDANKGITGKFIKGKGCSHCAYTGYKGRIGIHELLVLDEPVRDSILQQKTSQEIRKISIDSTGLVTLLEDGIYKAACGLTTIDEVLRCLPRLQKPRSLGELKRLLGEI